MQRNNLKNLLKNQNPQTHVTKPSHVLPPYYSLKMDSLIRQTRRRQTTSRDKTREASSSTREKNLPARKSVSFKEDKRKSPNWLQKQFSRQMSELAYDPISDMDYAAAVAATAYAITTFEETWLHNYNSGLELGPSLSRSKSRREDGVPYDNPRSLSKRFAEQLSFIEPELNNNKHPTSKSPVRKSKSVKKTPTFSLNLRGNDDDHFKDSQESWEKHGREPLPPERIQPPQRTRSERRAPVQPPPPPPPLSPPPLRLPPRDQSYVHPSRKDDSAADAWEKAELAKIKAKYDKLNRKIDSWEAKKRDKARRKLEKTESELEQRRRRGLQRFREDTEYIEQIAAGARAQADKQRQSEEYKVKEKTAVIRSTGKLPGKACLCF